MIFYHRRCGGKRLAKKRRIYSNPKVQLAALLLCVSLLAGLLPALVLAEDAKHKFSEIATFDSITLHYAGADGQPEEAVIQDGTLIEKNRQLALRYTYTITGEQCGKIKANTPYNLDVSPHLVLPHLESGSSLTVETGEGTQEQFGMIYSNGASAWVTFDAKENSTDTVLSDYGELNNAYFYLDCTRAADVPAGEDPIEGHSNLYAMKVEKREILQFGYAEHEPVTARAQIAKGGSLTDKTITWTINYTPWQNPAENDSVAPDTPFELRDTIASSLHSYVPGSVRIDGRPVTNTSRDENAETYVLVETPADGGDTTLTFGGTKFKAGQATQGNPAKPLEITYQTSINDNLLLPGGTGGKKVTNAADLFAGENGVFNSLNISSSKTIAIPQPTWLTKEGHTTRHTDGTGSTTDWTVTFQPNGFHFGAGNKLTLHDQLPPGSSLVGDSVKITINSAVTTKPAAKNDAENSFTVSGIETNNQPVTITYQTHVPEDMYDSGTSLGSNTAWFTFDYNGSPYSTPKATTPVGSGDGSGTPGTATLVKENSGYKAASRTIDWTVKINPHQAYLKGGTFTDDLRAIGPRCTVGHTSGLELENSVNDINVLIGGKPDNSNLVRLDYSNQQITITVGEIGAKTVTLTYTTKVCDPCIFANNTAKTAFKNTISTTDMIIGSQSTTGRSASAESIANVSAAVLTKKPPVYDYASGTMKWTVEVDAAGLPMADVVLTDELPKGLTYVENSLATDPEISGASASVNDQTLAIDLGTVTGKTIVTFDTRVDPEVLGFSGDKPVVVENTIRMNGKADEVGFAEVSHHVQQSFSNHGLVKSSAVKDREELIQYEVLINPYRLALSENPSLVDTLDKRLQLDADTLKFYKVTLVGTSGEKGNQKPAYQNKEEIIQPPKVTGFDPAANSYTVQLPIPDGSTDAYLLTYTADIMDYQKGSYSNSVRFEGGSVLLGGGKNNSASTSGGGGGGGGGVAARKAAISIVKTDSETQSPLSGVSFTLYQWDSDTDTRGLPFAQGKTGAQGKLSFRVKPGAAYELVETESLPGYGSAFVLQNPQSGVTQTDGGLLVTAGEKGKTLTLNLTNEALTADIVFRLVNASGIPMAGVKVQLFREDPTGKPDPAPDQEAAVSADGTVKFSSVRRGRTCFIRYPENQLMTVEVPADDSKQPTAALPDGTPVQLTAAYKVPGSTPADQQWKLTVNKVISGGETPLAGAEIGLYADAACQTLIKSEVSGEDGTAAFDGLIKNQEYWVKEIAAPGGYQLNGSVYKGTEDLPNVTIENTPSPVNSGSSGSSGNSGNPDAPGDPDSPGASGEPGAPGEPDTPGNSSSEVSAGGPDTPRTGDDIRLLAAATLFSGIMLAAMAPYQFWESKKREK